MRGSVARLTSVRSVVPGLIQLLAVLPLGFLAMLAPVIRLYAMAWFLRRQKVKESKIRKWALREAKKRRADRLVKIVAALFRRSS